MSASSFSPSNGRCPTASIPTTDRLAGAYGLPLPYVQFSNVSSLQFNFLPQAYVFDIACWFGLAWVSLRLLARAWPRFSLAGRAGIGGVAALLLIAWIAALGFAIESRMLWPQSRLFTRAESYLDFRPVAVTTGARSRNDCRASDFWFAQRRR